MYALGNIQDNVSKTPPQEGLLTGFVTTSCRPAVAGLLGLAISFGLTPAQAQGNHPWLDQKLLPAAKAEGSLIVYSSTNEGEGLPLWKIFEEATGIKVQYVRAADGPLLSRMAIEFRSKQKAWDLVQVTSIAKVPAPVMAQIEPPEAKHIIPEARDPGKRWYGLYANYNAPAYNTEKVKASELPKSYEEFATHKEWAGKVAIDGTDNEWLKALYVHYGEKKGMQIAKDIAANLKPVLTDGHLAMARATGAGEYWLSLNNYVNLSNNVKLKGGPIEVFALDPVALMFGQVGVSSLAPHPNAARLAANFMLSQECQQFLAKFGRLPTRDDVKDNPPGTIAMLRKHKVITVLFDPAQEKEWQAKFKAIFRPR
jgi:iron(III) transport system substrate-binding protein